MIPVNGIAEKAMIRSILLMLPVFLKINRLRDRVRSRLLCVVRGLAGGLGGVRSDLPVVEQAGYLINYPGPGGQ